MDKIVNNEIVEQVKKAMPEEESLYDVAELFKVFGDSCSRQTDTPRKQSKHCPDTKIKAGEGH